ncbi:DUF262 domain-containing protein [Shewanella woodyi]|uniref:GmrSD restriction endonucleases N-terminal domain-containing protein n=1 Tax=Shewanella woodyi (strain ATCC 51908 / MS32) TaxID=392500 RepID=B1KDK0_SHEWM|nr:DUF262 domain-containing protein [Shewanella woodyi]ACA85001.1 protein of unknown function DUF262 [Shewanella woodyi ATCC 51908]
MTEQIDDPIEIEAQEELELAVHPHPMGTETQIRIAKEQSSVYELLRKESKGLLVLAPAFQRIDVWDKKHKSELIESILMGIPIPLIYLFEDEYGIRQIVDGKQRITALKEFINNSFSLSELSMLPQLKGLKFEQIPSLLQAKLEDYQLQTYVIQPPTPESVKFNLFERVNRGGVNLNKQEMRHALYQGRATVLLEELAMSQEFQLATGFGVKSNRMRDRYLILRFIAFYLYFTNQLPNIQYRLGIDGFLASVMRFVNQAPKELIEHVRHVSLLGMRNSAIILGENGVRFAPKKPGGNKRPVNMGLFEMLIFTFCYVDLSIVNHQEIKRVIERQKFEIDQMDLLAGSIDTTANVTERFNLAQQLIQRAKYA